MPADEKSPAGKVGYTWHFSMQGLPETMVTHGSCELLPHIFTLIPRWRNSYFLWHYLFLLHIITRPGSSPVHCPALSGLS
jgi:hypothetical protein